MPSTGAQKLSGALAELSRTLQDISKEQTHSQGSYTQRPSVESSVRVTANQAYLQSPRSKRVPHYLAETTLHKDRLFRYLYGISIFINVVYFALRIVYIVTGKVKVRPPDGETATEEQLQAVEDQNAWAIVYSSIVLVAEFGGFILVHVGQQMFTRQKTKFAKMSPENVAKMSQVLLRCCALPSTRTAGACNQRACMCTAMKTRHLSRPGQLGEAPACVGVRRARQAAAHLLHRVHVLGGGGDG